MLKKIKNRYSIFLKLIILFLIFIVLVNISIGFVISWIFGKGPVGFPGIGGPPGPPGQGGPPDRFPKAVRMYVAEKIGNPPDTITAKKLSAELDLSIRIETPDYSWSSDDFIPGINLLRNEKGFRTDDNNFVVRFKRKPVFVNRAGSNYVIFSPSFPIEPPDESNAFIIAIIIVTILALLLYFSLRWIFGPVKKLSEGVQRISEGDFESDIDVRRKDELGNLAESINEMKVNISNMIKSKESLLIDVSHELRSPLTRIKLANEFIEDKKIHDKIRDDVLEMESMITELLETYRFEKLNEKLKIEKTDLIEIAQKVRSKFFSHSIVFESNEKEAFIFADSKKIETALFNIADNAVKYSEGKPVIMSIYRNDENNVCISVKDSGRGIEEKELNKIFEPFYRVDKSRDKKVKGYGLGLSLVKKILSEHDAVIEVKSKINEGTEFVITFPDKIKE